MHFKPFRLLATFAFTACVLMFSVAAFAQVDPPAPSPNAWLTPNLLMWLGGAVIVLTGVKQALHADTFDAMLARLSLPAIPKMLVPWLMLVVGLVLGFVTGLVDGKPWQSALSTSLVVGISGLFVGATGGGGTAAANPKLAYKDGTPRVDDIDNAKAKGSIPPPSGVGGASAIALLCIALPLAGLLGIAAATEGCSTQQAQAVTPPVADLAKCVAEGALAGDSLAELVTKCGGDVPAIIGALFSSKEPAVKSTKAHAEARRAVALDAGAP